MKMVDTREVVLPFCNTNAANSDMIGRMGTNDLHACRKDFITYCSVSAKEWDEARDWLLPPNAKTLTCKVLRRVKQAPSASQKGETDEYGG